MYRCEIEISYTCM